VIDRGGGEKSVSAKCGGNLSALSFSADLGEVYNQAKENRARDLVQTCINSVKLANAVSVKMIQELGGALM